MARGKVIAGGQAQRYQPPDAVIANGVGETGSPEARIEEAIRAGFAQGFNRGRQEAQAACQAEWEAQQQRFAAVLGKLHDLEAALYEELRGPLLDLGLEIAARVVRTRIEAEDPVALRAVEEILSSEPRTVSRTIKVNPDEFELILGAIPHLGEPGTISVVPDQTLGRGDVLIESGEEAVDARVSTAFRVLHEMLEEER